MHIRTVIRVSGLAVIMLLVSSNSMAGLDDWLKKADGLIQQHSAQESNKNSAKKSMSVLPESRINAGLKQALSLGAERAIKLLSANGGFRNDPAVKIELPGLLKSVGKGMRAIGQGKYVDQFENTVNSAAEDAISNILKIVLETIKTMTPQDVQGILNGGNDAATKFLKNRSGPWMHATIKPIVEKATGKAGVTSAYKELKKKADSSMGGFFDFGGLDLDEYVTQKTLDGLFLKLAQEESRIRNDPVARTTDLLKQVFGN